MDNTTLFIVFLAVVLLGIILWKKFGNKMGGFSGGWSGVNSSNHHSKNYDDYEGAYAGGRQRELRIFAQEPWFSEMKAGRKIVEARVGDPGFYEKNVGKPAIVKTPGGGDHPVVIKAVRHHADLDSYLEKEDLKKYAPQVKTKSEAKSAYLALKDKAGNQIFEPSRVKEKGGITAIELGPHHK